MGPGPASSQPRERGQAVESALVSSITCEPASGLTNPTGVRRIVIIFIRTSESREDPSGTCS